MPNKTKNAPLVQGTKPATLSHETAKTPKSTFVLSENGDVLLKIKSPQAYDLSNQMSEMFTGEDLDLKPTKHFIMEMLEHSMQDESGINAIYIRNCKDWLATLEILFKIYKDTQKVR